MSASVASPLLREDDQGIPRSLPLLAALVEAEARCCAAARPADSGPVHAFRAGAVPKVPVRIFLERIYLLARSVPAMRGKVRIDGAAGSACCAGLGRVGSRSCGVRRIDADEAARLRRSQAPVPEAMPRDVHGVPREEQDQAPPVRNQGAQVAVGPSLGLRHRRICHTALHLASHCHASNRAIDMEARAMNESALAETACFNIHCQFISSSSSWLSV